VIRDGCRILTRVDGAQQDPAERSQDRAGIGSGVGSTLRSASSFR
jgi:hypothetical protein